jgi:hypothetical protein
MFEKLLKFLREDQTSISDKLSSGGCVDFCDYQYNVGIMKGLVIAEEEIVRLLGEMEDND